MARLRANAPPVRLIVKAVRLECFAVVAVALVGVLVMLVLAARIGAVDEALARCPSHPCAADDELATLAGWASATGALVLVLPIAAGIVLGGPLVAAEIERKTAALAWSIAPSRGRWLAERIVVLGAIVAFVGAILALASTALVGALHPGVDLGRSFDGYEARGLLVVAHGLLAFALAVFVGSLVGRILPAVLLAAIVFGLLVAGLRFGFNALNRTEAVELPPYDSGGLVLTTLIRDPVTGRLLTPDEAFGPGSPGLADFDVVNIGLPGDRVGVAVGRESGIELGLALVACGGVAVAVARRRPM